MLLRHKKFAALSEAELEAMSNECQAHDEELRSTGKLFIQASLSEPQTWRSIRAAGDGQPTVADGSYTTAQEQVGAFFIFEANNIEEATQTALKHPGTYVGKYVRSGIEVRACEGFEQY